ncbi:Ku70 (human XRCC6 ortholog) Pku70 [Schizosaccharomyces pombe]|uniref:ATP-dependent DNA helicase II subunit 1 n=1 Tax=Schizosaccharomyces pombe (strain 972 / ATCC 24843) TaxID=284812 RepID=KU70_SCHPO|nr:Ku domain protein Pku70 [Schizosaccharomyces pombe]O94395.1 RecName: Full=ATP-dependent DNA helicase II subunit 1; AltName: Full=ATP-dependent DNA helicase II subunit Ku70 [Schizosaccharomyces pombe 972h-]CAA22471.1 Ku domain protein Pku70 [Schizosaccharomyces pombe]|eukprot:NP_001342782.1 Ku domain protein Pku70 [Schizosaccharomyces pombe]
MENDEQIDETENFAIGKYAILFVIEVSPSMLDPVDEFTPSSLQMALICAYQLAAQRVITNPSDIMGVLLYGTESSTGRFANQMMLLDIDPPDAERIKSLQSFEKDFQFSKEKFKPCSCQVSLSSVLYHCSVIFTTKAENFEKRLFLITDNDHPAWDATERDIILQRAKDLRDLDIQVHPVFLDPPTHSFRINIFYSDFLYIVYGRQDVSNLVNRGQAQLQHMLNMITALQKPKRAHFHLKMDLGNDVRIGVEAFILLKRLESAKTNWVYAKGERFAVAVPQSKQVSFATKKELKKDEIRRSYSYGGSSVVFGSDELNKVRSFEPPTLRIIGFRDFSTLKPWHCLKPAVFLRPKDDEIIGSGAVFSAIHKKLLASNKIGIAWFVSRPNANPCFVAMLATPGSIHIRDDFELPLGIFLVQLPTADDIRSLPPINPNPISMPSNLIETMQRILRGMELRSYQPGKYNNPSLQWHYKVLQALALDEEIPTDFVDNTLPKYKAIQKRVGEYMGDVNNIVAEYRNDISDKNGIKEEEEDQGPIVKKARIEKSGKPIFAEDDRLKQLYIEGVLDKEIKALKVSQLKDILRDRGLRVSGKKADLLDNLTNYVKKL